MFLATAIGASSTTHGSELVVDTSNATIETRDGGRLHVVFPNEAQPAVVLRPAQGAWDWAAASKLFSRSKTLRRGR